MANDPQTPPESPEQDKKGPNDASGSSPDAQPAEEGARADEATQQPPPQPQQVYADPRELRIQSLERLLAEREATLHTYIRAHKQAQGEFEAYKQRLERDRVREVEAATGKLFEKLLDVDENLARTIQAAEQAQRTGGSIDPVISGVKLVHKLFLERMQELGLERVDPKGLPFDPTSMEALGVVPVDEPSRDGKVAVTLRAGFRFGSRELRPALVQIGKVLG